MRSLAPIARSVSSLLSPGLPHPVRSASRFSQPLDGLLLETPCGLVSCRWHFRGSPCRAFPLKEAPNLRQVRCETSARSVHILPWCYPQQAADALLGPGAFQGTSPTITDSKKRRLRRIIDSKNHPLMYFGLNGYKPQGLETEQPRYSRVLGNCRPERSPEGDCSALIGFVPFSA
jgi:hypothetical protein